jgi:hypothetical protein
MDNDSADASTHDDEDKEPEMELTAKKHLS